jgi:hypothetical protein
VIDADAAEQSARYLGRSRIARASPLLLPGVPEIRNDGCYSRRACGADRVRQQRQYHQMFVDWRTRGLHEKDGRIADIVSDVNPRLAIGERADFCRRERNPQLEGQAFGKRRMGVARNELQISWFSR